MGYMYGQPQAIGPAISELPEGEYVPSAIVGFRAWKPIQEPELGIAPKYKSAADHDWMPIGPVRAQCRCTRNTITGELANPDKHECGFYAYKHLERCLREFVNSRPALIGMVVFWGRMWEAEHGWRSYHARPIALLDPQPYVAEEEDWWREIPLPALPLDDLISYARMFGYVEDQESKEPKAA